MLEIGFPASADRGVIGKNNVIASNGIWSAMQQHVEKKVKEICFLKRAAFNHNCSWFSPAIPISAVHYVLPDRDYLQSPTQKA